MELNETPQAGDIVTRPDPSRLATAQLQREISALHETLMGEIRSLDQRLQRHRLELDGMPHHIDEKVEHLRSLFAERFRTVSVKFRERESRDKEQKQASARALSAALKAAQDIVAEQNRSSAAAVAKSEANMSKQIEQLATLMGSSTGALRDIVDDVKARLALIEGRSSGMSSGWGYIVAAVGLAATVIMVIMALTR